MAYDRVVILNPSTGTTESFRTRISREAVAEWVAEREALTSAGYPDRPPDVDMPTTRAWVQHPGEEHHPYFAGKTGDPAWPVLTARWHGGTEVDISIALFWSTDHYGISILAAGTRVREFHWPKGAKVRSDNTVRATRDFPLGVTEDAVWAEFELAIAAFNEADEWPEDDPLVTDYTDYAKLDIEIALAEADVARGFISPLPDAHD